MPDGHHRDSDSAPQQNIIGRLHALVARGTRDRSVWPEAAEEIRRARGYRWVGLYEVTDVEICAAAWTGSTPPAFPRFPHTRGLSGAAVAAKQPVVSQDVQNDPRYLTTFATTGSEAIYPVIAESGNVIGTIDVESDRVHAFSKDDDRFLRACAVALRPLWRDRGE